MFISEYIFSLWGYIMRDPITQISGFVAMFIIMIAMFQKDDALVKKLMLLSAFFWWAHFYLLWVYSALASVIIWVIRIIVSTKYEKDMKAFIWIVALTLFVWYFTVDSLLSSIPIIASLLWAYAFFFLEKVPLRIAMICMSQMFLIYNLTVWSISWVINEILVQWILIFTIYRMLHEQWSISYYLAKVQDILWHKHYPDYDRYIFVTEKISFYKKRLWTYFLQILRLDWLRSTLKKRWVVCNKFLSKLKDQ